MSFNNYAQAEIDCAATNHTVATIKSADDFEQASKTCISALPCSLGYIPRPGGGWDSSDGSAMGDNLGFNSIGGPFDSQRFPWGNTEPSASTHIYLKGAREYATQDGATSTFVPLCNSCKSDSCIGNGICIEQVEGFRCACDDNNECLNGGTCIDPLTDDADFSCDCPEGFECTFCEVSISEVCPTLNPTKSPSGSSSSDDIDSGDAQFSALRSNERNVDEINDKESIEINLSADINLYAMIAIVMISLIMHMCLWCYCGQRIKWC